MAHDNMYSTADDMATFLTTVAEGRLVSRGALMRFWKLYEFPNGNNGYFASGWECAESDAWHEVGHDGGAKLRVRILFRKDLDDHFVIVYLTNGSRDNVWSRTLVDSVQQLVLAKKTQLRTVTVCRRGLAIHSSRNCFSVPISSDVETAEASRNQNKFLLMLSHVSKKTPLLLENCVEIEFP